MSVDPTGDLRQQAEDFASDLSDTLTGSLPGAPETVAELSDAGRLVIRPVPDVPLCVSGEQLASLAIRIGCVLDSRGTWLAIEFSTIEIKATVDRTPVFRFDYLRKPSTVPSAHIQIHAHRGALAHLLSKANHPKPHDMSALHIPVGGARFRPCVEDVIQFLISDCGFDSLPEWQTTLNAGRERWRRTQARAVTRDFPGEAAHILRDLGYEVKEPKDGAPESPWKALHIW